MTNKIFPLPECLNSVEEEVLFPLELKYRGRVESCQFSVEPLGEHVSEMSRDIHNTSPLTVNLLLSCPDSFLHFWQRAIRGIDSPTSTCQSEWMTRLLRRWFSMWQGQEKKDRDVFISHLHLGKQIKKEAPAVHSCSCRESGPQTR